MSVTDFLTLLFFAAIGIAVVALLSLAACLVLIRGACRRLTPTPKEPNERSE